MNDDLGPSTVDNGSSVLVRQQYSDLQTDKVKSLQQNFLFKTWTNVVSLSTLYKLCAPQFESYFYTDLLSNEIGASILRQIKRNLLFIIFESNYKFQILLSNRKIIIVLIIKYF